ncbi:MAG: Reversal of tor2 lethality [Cyphobasidiales sp. Tagirdzhanova-0007]|nr:MAG: Reversal of tor2 lethality [Cyphobasidiales sp. Tagirdzhanova-0007]
MAAMDRDMEMEMDVDVDVDVDAARENHQPARSGDWECGHRKRRSPQAAASRTAATALFVLACMASSAISPVRADNITSITGTWSSGSGAVLTGPGFAQPTNFTFTYPNTTGISYSFTDDGYYEEAQYRFNANGSEPHCVQAVIIWQHGNYSINANNSISLNPIAPDGRIQIQDPCAADTNVITYYDHSEFYSGWSITNDINHNRYMLQLLAFDGSLLPRMYLLYRPPTMLPSYPTTVDLISLQGLPKRARLQRSRAQHELLEDHPTVGRGGRNGTVSVGVRIEAAKGR